MFSLLLKDLISDFYLHLFFLFLRVTDCAQGSASVYVFKFIYYLLLVTLCELRSISSALLFVHLSCIMA